MDTAKIKAVIQEPGKISMVIDYDEIPDRLKKRMNKKVKTEELQKHGLYLLYDSRVIMPNNVVSGGRMICGTAVVVAMENGRTVDMSVSQIQQARSWLLKHSV